MSVRSIIIPESANQILLIVLLWIGVTVAIAQIFESPWVRWETLLGSAVVFAWTAWAVYYRLDQYQQKEFARNKNHKWER